MTRLQAPDLLHVLLGQRQSAVQRAEPAGRVELVHHRHRADLKQLGGQHLQQ